MSGALLRRILVFFGCKEEGDEVQPLKAVSLKGRKFPVRGLIALIGGVLLMGTNSIDFSYGRHRE